MVREDVLAISIVDVLQGWSARGARPFSTPLGLRGCRRRITLPTSSLQNRSPFANASREANQPSWRKSCRPLNHARRPSERYCWGHSEAHYGASVRHGAARYRHLGASPPAGAMVTIMNNGGWAVGWFTLTFINSSIAQSKNRSGILWWFISLFLGPIATVILAVIPAEPPRTTT